MTMLLLTRAGEKSFAGPATVLCIQLVHAVHRGERGSAGPRRCTKTVLYCTVVGSLLVDRPGANMHPPCADHASAVGKQIPDGAGRILLGPCCGSTLGGKMDASHAHVAQHPRLDSAVRR